MNALKLPTKVLSGLFVASVILLSLDKTEVLALSAFGSLAKPATILLCVVSGALTFTAIIAFLIDLFTAERKKTVLKQRRDMRKAEEDEQFERQKQKVLSRIEYLSKDELKYLADCLRENSQTFTTYVHSPSASTLGSKGLIYTPGGTHHQDYYPFVVNDFVWQYLLDHKAEIIARDEENTRKEEERKRNARNRRY
ncbi:super-infection exclusion protein B [Rheinheimera sp. UJ51]|uniref:super-infection exclusion protein B n=1 Tax=Rheinheimera sp. UJ51 TaxID=2892446 RepID=UPI002D1F9CD5|nr:super-infection exclusion protein B [Rheinheimera sp. UJ51]MCC5451500.1 super-infection exclusion protein B [Rheinheimera sp. UJ51]